MVKKIVLSVCLICILVAGCLGVYYGKAVLIKKAGIRVTPSEVYKPRNTKVFLQNDPQWANDLMGSSKFRLGGHGCLVSILASALNDLGCETNPKELNRVFTEKGVYNSEGEVVWYKISEAFSGISYDYKRVFSGKTLQNDLAEGRLPIVMVRYHKTGVFHWVLVIGTDGGDFLIIDPLKQDRKAVGLSIHGKVYAYRVLSKGP